MAARHDQQYEQSEQRAAQVVCEPGVPPSYGKSEGVMAAAEGDGGVRAEADRELKSF